jgi:hypothetical protein
MKFLIIMIAIGFFLPRIMRFGLKLFITKQMNKVQRDFQTKSASAHTQKEGEIKVDINKKANNNESIKGGEYIDYEEVKD